MPSTVVATILFTDLVDSTALSSRLSAEAAEAVRQTHFGLLRAAIQVTGGVEVKNLGDGLMVSFTSPSRAIACAVGMQQGLESHNRRADAPLVVRIGLSAGEVTEDDDDYFGDPVVEAARLCGVAEGGQILATEVVRAMVGRHSTQTFVSVGALELKGLPNPIDAAEVIWEPEVVAGTVPLPARLVGAANDAVFGFFGRSDALTQIGDALKRATADESVQTVLIAGEAGIGKTALVAQAAREAHEQGTTVLLGRCSENLVVPYQPWVEALTHLLEHRPELLDTLAPAHRSALARLVPRLGEESPPAGDAETERLLLLDAFAIVLKGAATDGAVLVLLDDLQWSDAATVQAIRYLIGSSVPVPAVLACTYRDTDLSRGDALTALLADLHRESRVARHRLLGLDDQELMDYVTAAAGHELDEDGIGLAHALRRETGGNPFFTSELLRHLYNSGAIYLNDEGRWVLRGSLDELELPASVRDVVGRRVERLGEESTRVLSLAAVIGREFDVDLLGAVSDVHEDALLDLLDAATSAALVVETELPCRYRFAHALIQHGLYQDLGAARRQRAHLRIAQVLEDSAGEPSAAELARHWVAATRPADLDQALSYVEQAGDAALGALAPEDAMAWYRQALELAERQGADDARRRVRLLIGLGTAQRQIGIADCRGTLLEAARGAQEIGDVDLLVGAALASLRGVGQAAEGDADRIAMVRAALEAIGQGDSPQRARLLGGLVELLDPRDSDTRHAMATEAVAVAERCGDDSALLFVLNIAFSSVAHPATLPVRLEQTQAAIEIADRLGDVYAGAQARYNRIGACMEAADLVEVDQRLAELGDVARTTRLGYLQWVEPMARSWRALLVGDTELAEALADEALAVGTRTGQIEALGTYGGQLFEIRRHQGRLDEIIEFFESVAADNPAIPVLQIAIATGYVEIGRLDDARPILEHQIATDLTELPRDSQWQSGIHALADIAATLGDRSAALVLHDLAAPYASLIAFPLAVFVGSYARPLGRLTALLGRPDDADVYFRQALDTHQRLGAQYWIALTQLDWADVLLERVPKVGLDDARVGPAIERARQAARTYGYAGIERRARALLGETS